MVQAKTMTVEEFDRFALLPENADRLLEYIGGEVVEVVSNNYVSVVAMIIGARLATFVYEHGLGLVTGANGGYCVSGERYIPKAAYISITRQPESSHDAYNPNAPDLAVEVISPSNTGKEIRIKVANYLSAGTMMWVVDPDAKQVEVYVPGQPVRTLTVKDTLDGGDLLPGFTLAVKTIFPV